MKKIFTPALLSNDCNLKQGLLLLMVIILATLAPVTSQAQIWEPEGLNMPGQWNSWTNPPVNNLALASFTQVPGGRVTKINTGIVRWQTIFSVAATGADVVGGTHNWLFTSGPEANPWGNKWANVTVAMNTLQTYVKESPTDNSITVVNGKWYTMNWKDNGYSNTEAIFMETSAEPVQLLSVSEPVDVIENEAVVVTVTTNLTKSAEEIIYVRYTTNAWSTSALLTVTMTGTSGTATIPGQAEGTTVEYYAFSSTVTGITANYDLYSIRINNDNGANYSYVVGGTPIPIITWANLQWPPNGTVEPGEAFEVYAQVLAPGITEPEGQGTGITAWIGYSTTNTDPSTWTNWVAATYNTDAGNNDEYKADIGSVITEEGTYYYASRFKLNDGDYVYGGYAASGGGFWDGTNNVSGVLTVSIIPPPTVIDWANLQWPENGEIEPGADFEVYAQIFIDGVTNPAGQAAGVTAWIGYNSENTNPSEWNNWTVADYNADAGNNDEYLANIGTNILTEGTYYYASRFQFNGGEFYYGGFNGGFWDGETNVSGVLTVVTETNPSTISWANLQWPATGNVLPEQEYLVYAQVYAPGITEPEGQGADIQTWIGYSETDTDPSGWTNWVAADYLADAGNNDEYMADIGTLITEEGTYYYASRFQYATEEFVYGGYSESGGGFWDGENFVSGVLTVGPPPVTYPVLFTIIDATELHDNIKFKGEMTGWDTIAMNPDNHVWTLTLDVLPGTYEWGAIEDDGSEFGIWLIEGANLVVTIDEEGNVSGDTSYTTLITVVGNRPVEQVSVYPNPANDRIKLSSDSPASYRIRDAEGRVIIHDPLMSSTHHVNINHLPSGLYVVELISENGSSFTKLIKK
jgi:hypothetical protein